MFFKAAKNFINSSSLKDFTLHNKFVFPVIVRESTQNKKIILFELNNLQSSIIAYSYFASVLARKYRADIQAYLPVPHKNLLRKYFYEIKKHFNLQEFSSYRSFGTNFFFEIKFNKNHLKRAQELAHKILTNLTDNWSIEQIIINGVWVGDLFYDSYLRDFNKATINKDDLSFKIFLEKSIALFLYWEDYFNSHDVKAINVSHCEISHLFKLT